MIRAIGNPYFKAPVFGKTNAGSRDRTAPTSVIRTSDVADIKPDTILSSDQIEKAGRFLEKQINFLFDHIKAGQVNADTTDPAFTAYNYADNIFEEVRVKEDGPNRFLSISIRDEKDHITRLVLMAKQIDQSPYLQRGYENLKKVLEANADEFIDNDMDELPPCLDDEL